MQYLSEVDGSKFNLHMIKRGREKKGKTTISKNVESMIAGEIYPPEGANVFSISHSSTLYFTGNLFLVFYVIGNMNIISTNIVNEFSCSGMLVKNLKQLRCFW